MASGGFSFCQNHNVEAEKKWSKSGQKSSVPSTKPRKGSGRHSASHFHAHGTDSFADEAINRAGYAFLSFVRGGAIVASC
jgi:hypothetical protein